MSDRNYNDLWESVEAWAAENLLRHPREFAETMVEYAMELIGDFEESEGGDGN